MFEKIVLEVVVEDKEDVDVVAVIVDADVIVNVVAGVDVVAVIVEMDVVVD